MTPGARVALRNDSYTLHVLLPTKVDPLVSLMKVGGLWAGIQALLLHAALPGWRHACLTFFHSDPWSAS